MGDICPGSFIDIKYDRDEGSLEFIVDDNAKGEKIVHEGLKKGNYFLTAMWMKDDQWFEISHDQPE